MKLKLIRVFALFIFILIVVFLLMVFCLKPGGVLPIDASFLIGNEKVWLEVPRTIEQINHGLMYRKKLVPNHGMLFSFEKPDKHGFWMRNCLIPLDIIFILNNEVKQIITMQPCSQEPCKVYMPTYEIDMAIELRNGEAARLGIQENTKIFINYEN